MPSYFTLIGSRFHPPDAVIWHGVFCFRLGESWRVPSHARAIFMSRSQFSKHHQNHLNRSNWTFLITGPK
eukprot:scaffold14974_cov195-Amphora_coffeaeformis.AAC.57